MDIIRKSLRGQAFLFCAFLLALPAHAELKVADYFSDHMVLQRNQPVQIWGTAAANDVVKVVLGADTGSATAGPQGNWLITLPARPESSTPVDLKITANAEEKTFRDVLIGDVWLIAGQSNVVLTLAASSDAAQAKTDPILPEVRVCKLPGSFAFEPLESFPRKISWDVLNPARVASYLSGVGYYFIRKIQPAVGVPMGLVQASAGGTQVEQWTPEAALKATEPNNPLFAVRDAARARLAADPAAKIGVIQSGASSLYNGNIHPFRFAKFKGVVWYQGEANTRSKRDYRTVLKTFVLSWREVFRQSDLPFVIVQLPNFGLPKDDGWMRVREAQRLVAQELGLALAVTIDQGSATTIHPANKAEVGRRAGLAALEHVYKQDVEGTSPYPVTIDFKDNAALIEFAGFQGALEIHGDTVAGFELAGDDGKFLPASARVEGARVTVSSPQVNAPVAVRYLWNTSPEVVSLWSAAGLPVGPFTSVSKK